MRYLATAILICGLAGMGAQGAHAQSGENLPLLSEEGREVVEKIWTFVRSVHEQLGKTIPVDPSGAREAADTAQTLGDEAHTIKTRIESTAEEIAESQEAQKLRELAHRTIGASLFVLGVVVDIFGIVFSFLFYLVRVIT